MTNIYQLKHFQIFLWLVLWSYFCWISSTSGIFRIDGDDLNSKKAEKYFIYDFLKNSKHECSLIFIKFSIAKGVPHNGMFTGITLRKVGPFPLECEFQESRKFHVLLMLGFYYWGRWLPRGMYSVIAEWIALIKSFNTLASQISHP